MVTPAPGRVCMIARQPLPGEFCKAAPQRVVTQLVQRIDDGATLRCSASSVAGLGGQERHCRA